MSNPSISFGKGLQNNLPLIKDGQILFATDTGNLFIDNGTERIQINANKTDKDIIGNSIVDTYETKVNVQTLLATYELMLRQYIDSKIFVGTREEYEVANNQNKIALNALVIITDDEDIPDSGDKTSSILSSGILGYMILGEKR